MKKRILLICLCLALVLLSGCAKKNEEAEARLEAGARGVIDCILADDLDGAYDLVSGATDKEAFLSSCEPIVEMLAGVESYTLSRLSTDTSGDLFSLSFRMEAVRDGEAVTYMLTASEKTGTAGLYTFYIQRNVATPVGALTRMGEANALQWVLVCLGGVAWIFTVIAAIDCGLHAKKNRGFMLFLILFGFVTLSFTTAPDFVFSITHGYRFPYSALLYYETGEITTKVFLPLGAIGYFLLRRRFVHPKDEN